MLFRGGNVFYNKKFVSVDVRIQNGIICEIGADLPEKEEEVINLAGRKLLPGCIDVHTHGRNGKDFSYASSSEIIEVTREYARNGVTSILATTMTLGERETEQMVTRIGEAIHAKNPGSRILGINLEGPFLGKDKKGCHDERLLLPVNQEKFEKWDNLSGGNILMVDLDPNYEETIPFIKHYEKKKIISIAHTSATYEKACQAVEAGAFHVTHLFNAMNSLHHREPGILGMVYDKPIYAELITDGLHVHPSLIRMMFAMIPEKLCLVSDSLSATGCEDGVYELGGLSVIVKDGKACLADGTLACSTISVFEGMKRCIQFGVPQEQAILAATYQPACSVRMEHMIGSISEGLKADLVITDKDYQIEMVYVGGEKI